MNRKQFYILTMAAAATMTLAACTADDGPQAAPQQEISLSSTVGGDGVTRSFDATNLIKGDTVYVWADMVNATDGKQTEYFKAWGLKATNNVGGLSSLYSSDARLFPASNALNFYALVGNFGTDEDGEPFIKTHGIAEADKMALPVTGILHTVIDDQHDADAYYKSDLLYAVRKNQEPTAQAVVLPFRHLLARIEVVLVAGNGMQASDLSEATVKLLDLKRQVTFKPDSTKDVSTDEAALANLPAMLTIPVGAQQGDILMATEAVQRLEDISATTYADAIVVPKQTITAGTRFIEVDYLDRQTFYTLKSDFTIESGKQYRFRLICDRIGETYELNTVSVEDWGPAGTALPVWLDTEAEE